MNNFRKAIKVLYPPHIPYHWFSGLPSSCIFNFAVWILFVFFAVLIQKDRGNGPFDVLASYPPQKLGRVLC